MIKSIFKKIFPSYFDRKKGYYFKKLNRLLSDCRTVLDIGCGNNSPLAYINKSFLSYGADLFWPLLKESRNKAIHDYYIQIDAHNLCFKEKGVDAVVALDLLEHLEKTESINLLNSLEEIADRKIVIFTPNGFVDISQDQIYEMFNSNPWQSHKCGWKAKELRKIGYKVYGINGLKYLRHGPAKIRFKPKKLWNILSYLTEPFVLKLPFLAYQLLCIKELK